MHTAVGFSFLSNKLFSAHSSKISHAAGQKHKVQATHVNYEGLWTMGLSDHFFSAPSFP